MHLPRARKALVKCRHPGGTPFHRHVCRVGERIRGGPPWGGIYEGTRRALHSSPPAALLPTAREMSDASRAARARHHARWGRWHGHGRRSAASLAFSPAPPLAPLARGVVGRGGGTAGLFTLGNAVTGDSSGQASVGSASGAAGSLVTWLVWG
jgi:hypothetical protein